MCIFGDDIFIFARKTQSPGTKIPSFILLKRSKFSSTDLSLYGLGVPGLVGTPRCSEIVS